MHTDAGATEVVGRMEQIGMVKGKEKRKAAAGALKGLYGRWCS